MILKYYINKDERGEFNADVRDPYGNTLLEITNSDFEDGWLKHKEDLESISDLLSNIGYDISQIEIIKAN